MKSAKITHIIITGMLAAALVVAVIAYSVAWYSLDPSITYPFSIEADGALSVGAWTVTKDGEVCFVPAVAMPGAIAEGLPYDVLTTYAESKDTASPSYIQKAAEPVSIVSLFNVRNAGEMEKVPLPKDDEGYTLFPKIVANSETYTLDIVWLDYENRIWDTMRKCIGYDEENDWAPIYFRDVAYTPQLDVEGNIFWNEAVQQWISDWKNGVLDDDTDELVLDYNLGMWKDYERVKPGSKESVVTVKFGFKATSDKEANDFFDSKNFVIQRVYVNREKDEVISDYDVDHGRLGAQYGNSGIEVHLDDNMLGCWFSMFGSEDYYLHVQAYLAQPDELLDPMIRGKSVFFVKSVSVLGVNEQEGS